MQHCRRKAVGKGLRWFGAYCPCGECVDRQDTRYGCGGKGKVRWGLGFGPTTYECGTGGPLSAGGTGAR